MRRWKLAIRLGTRHGCALACLCLAVMAGAAPQGQPDFTGIWVLNADKSDFGPVPPPQSMRYEIRHSGANLAFNFVQDEVKTRVDIITDGQERVTDSDANSEVWTRAYWSGPQLVFQARRRPRPAHETVPVSWTSRWSLSADGKVLTIDRNISTPNGEIKQTLVFDRQKPGVAPATGANKQ